MKKVLFILLSLLLVLLTSCSSLPKAPRAGKTIAAGRVEMDYSGYKDVSFNGKKYHGIQVSVKDPASGQIFMVTTDSDGYFYLPNLKTDTPYHIISFRFTSPNGSWIEWKDYMFDMFLSKDENTVLNLGTYYFSYNDETKKSNYEIKGSGNLKYYFEQQFVDTEFKIENKR